MCMCRKSCTRHTAGRGGNDIFRRASPWSSAPLRGRYSIGDSHLGTASTAGVVPGRFWRRLSQRRLPAMHTVSRSLSERTLDVAASKQSHLIYHPHRHASKIKRSRASAPALKLVSHVYLSIHISFRCFLLSLVNIHIAAMSLVTRSLVIYVLPLAVVCVYSIRNWFRQDRPFPGPPSHPIVGHALQVPTIKTWKYFEKLCRAYGVFWPTISRGAPHYSLWLIYVLGPIFQLSLGRDRIVVLNRSADAEELVRLGPLHVKFEFLSALAFVSSGSGPTTTRPASRSCTLESTNRTTSGSFFYHTERRLRDSGPHFIRCFNLVVTYRRIFHVAKVVDQPVMLYAAVGAYEAMQELESLRLLHDLLASPQDAFRHCQRFAASLVFNLSYGKRMEDNGLDLEGVIHILTNFVNDTYPGAHLVDMFPILDFLPDLCSPWRSEARKKHEFEMEVSFC